LDPARRCCGISAAKAVCFPLRTDLALDNF